MTRFYDMITTVDLAFAYYPYLLLLFFLFAFICFTVKMITDVSKKKRPKRRYIVITAVCGVICCGMGYGIYKDPPELIHGHVAIPTGQMVSLVGYDYNKCKSTYASYFDMEIDKEIYSSEYPAGVVIEHSPREGSLIAVGNTTVRCTVSKGPQMITVPNTYNVDRETACQMIEGAGLTYSFTDEYSETVPEGCVISTNPERNEVIERGSTVNIVVSKGKQMIIVPNVCGVSCENAGNMIEEAGLHYRLVFEYSETVPNGWAISTTPKAGEEVEKDSTVEIVVSKGNDESSENLPDT